MKKLGCGSGKSYCRPRSRVIDQSACAPIPECFSNKVINWNTLSHLEKEVAIQDAINLKNKYDLYAIVLNILLTRDVKLKENELDLIYLEQLKNFLDEKGMLPTVAELNNVNVMFSPVIIEYVRRYGSIEENGIDPQKLQIIEEELSKETCTIVPNTLVT